MFFKISTENTQLKVSIFILKLFQWFEQAFLLSINLKHITSTNGDKLIVLFAVRKWLRIFGTLLIHACRITFSVLDDPEEKSVSRIRILLRHSPYTDLLCLY